MRWYLGVLAKRHRSRLLLLCLVAAAILGIRSRLASARARTSRSDADAALEAMLAETADLAHASAKTRTTSMVMTRDRRLQWLRECARPPACEPWMVDAIVDGAPPDEQARALRVSFGAVAEAQARAATSDQLAADASSSIAGIIARPGMGTALLDELPTTTVASATKNPELARGKTLKVTGRVVELRMRDDGRYEGALAATLDGKVVVRFVTGMEVKGARVGAQATYRGVFLRLDSSDGSDGKKSASLFTAGALAKP